MIFIYQKYKDSVAVGRGHELTARVDVPVRYQILMLCCSQCVRMSISDIVREDVVTVYLEDSLLDVADVLREEGVGSAIVLDANGGVVGMITDRDLVIHGQHFADSLEETTVNKTLSMDVVSVTPDVGLTTLTETMREESVRRVPVVEEGDLYGIVTLDDVIVHLAEKLDNRELQNLAAVIESESPRGRSDGPSDET